jgi:CO/xanthine dehydrogenase FAD-binding subunit
MIKNYLRPDNLEDIVELLRKDPESRPLAGGSTLTQSQEAFTAVDLQNAGLSYIVKDNGKIRLGTMTTLEVVRQEFSDNPAIFDSLNIEASRNLREQATVGGTLFSSTGRSPFLTLLLGMDTQLIWLPGNKQIGLGNWLAQKNTWNEGVLVSEIFFDKTVNCRFHSIGRSPLDSPIICVALCTWPSNRMRLAIGGFGSSPMLILDGNTADNLEVAIETALRDSGDNWASSEYRITSATILAKRALADLSVKRD